MFNYSNLTEKARKIQKARFQRVTAFLKKCAEPGPRQLSAGTAPVRATSKIHNTI